VTASQAIRWAQTHPRHVWVPLVFAFFIFGPYGLVMFTAAIMAAAVWVWHVVHGKVRTTLAPLLVGMVGAAILEMIVVTVLRALPFGLLVIVLMTVGGVAWLRQLSRRGDRDALKRTAKRRAFAKMIRPVLGYKKEDAKDDIWIVPTWPEPGFEHETGATVTLRYEGEWPCDPRQRLRLQEIVADWLGGEWTSVVDRGQHRVTLTRLAPPAPEPTLPRHVGYVGRPATPDRYTLGVQLDGEFTWDLEVHPHMLVVGVSGAGKSNVLRMVLAMMACDGALVDVFDPKHDDDFDEFKGLPNVRIWTQLADMARIVRECHAEVEARHDIPKPKRLRMGLPRRVLVIDELGSFIGRVDAEVREAYIEILRQGRTADVRIVGGTQYPVDTAVGGVEARDLMCFKLAVGNLSINSSSKLFRGTPPPIDERIKGRGVVERGNKFDEVQVAELPKGQARGIAARGSARFAGQSYAWTTRDSEVEDAEVIEDVETPVEASVEQPVETVEPRETGGYRETTHSSTGVSTDETSPPETNAAPSPRGRLVTCRSCGNCFETTAKVATRCTHCGKSQRVPAGART
jgi:hypothetical protein